MPTNYTWLLRSILPLQRSNPRAWTFGDQWRQQRSRGPLEEAPWLASLARIIPVGGMKSKHSLPLISLAKEGDRHLVEAAPSPEAPENCLPGWQPWLGWRRDLHIPGVPPGKDSAGCLLQGAEDSKASHHLVPTPAHPRWPCHRNPACCLENPWLCHGTKWYIVSQLNGQICYVYNELPALSLQ